MNNRHTQRKASVIFSVYCLTKKEMQALETSNCSTGPLYPDLDFW